MANDTKLYTGKTGTGGALTTSGDATDWVLVSKGDVLAIVIPAGITGTVNVEKSFDGVNAETPVLTADDGTTNFASGANMEYGSDVTEYIRVIATTVTSGSATPKIKRN